MESSRKLTKGQVEDGETIVFDAGISRTLALTDLGKTIVFTGSNPVALTLPTNAAVFLPIGFKVKVAQQGAGIVTSSTAGISAISDCGYISAIGETRTYVKTDTNTWSIEGNQGSNNRTFTGTTTLPSTTSIGSITSTIIGFLSGITSNVQTQLNAKLTAATGTANYLQKMISTNVLGNSLIQEVNGFLGIGTINTPTKSLTFGNQEAREIGIEDSNSNQIGRDFKTKAGRTINYLLNSSFNSLNQLIGGWGIAKGQNNDVYFKQYGGEIYKQTGGVGNFSLYANVGLAGYAITIAPNGDIYCPINNFVSGHIAMQSGGIGSFNVVTATQRGWVDMASAVSGDIYATANSLLYKRTAGAGTFDLVNEAPLSSTRVACAPNGDVYVTGGNKIYRQVGGVGSFIDLLAPSLGYNYIACAPNNNTYISVGNQIYIMLSGSNTVTSTSQSIIDLRGLCFNTSGNAYAIALNEVYYQNLDALGTANLDGGIYSTHAGTGKGTGKSWWQVWTGQKTVSGTDMQVETLRIQANEVGEVILPSTTIAIIDAETTGKQLTTKEWIVSKFQSILVSGTNIKTINGTTLLGSGDIVVGGGDMTTTTNQSVSGTKTFTSLQKFTAGVNLVDDSPLNTFGLNKLIVRSNPSNIESTNPRMFDFVVSGRQNGDTGWHGGFNFIDNHNPTEIKLVDMKSTGMTVYTNLTVLGTFNQSKVLLSRNSDDILIAPLYNSITYSIKSIISSPFRIIEYKALASGGTGWHAKQIFYVKSNNDATERIAIETISQDNGTPLINLPGIVKPNQLNLSILQTYANDALAIVGGVAVGFAYINSVSMIVQRVVSSSNVSESSVPSQITITTTVSITTDTLDNLGYKQKGKNVVIDNGVNAINITVNGGTDFVSSYVKHGSGVITFVQGSGRTLIQVDATAVFNGVVGSTATISSVGLVDYLRISNA